MQSENSKWMLQFWKWDAKTTQIFASLLEVAKWWLEQCPVLPKHRWWQSLLTPTIAHQNDKTVAMFFTTDRLWKLVEKRRSRHGHVRTFGSQLPRTFVARSSLYSNIWEMHNNRHSFYTIKFLSNLQQITVAVQEVARKPTAPRAQGQVAVSSWWGYCLRQRILVHMERGRL